MVNINALHLGEAILVSQLVLPEGAKVQEDAEELVVQCIEAAPAEEEAAAPGEGAEPELIGRKAEEEEGEED
jgi:hypothetical protein